MVRSRKYFFLFLLIFFAIQLSNITFAQNLTTPEGVLFLKNKSFDNSESAQKEILDLYKDLRVTDVCDGMDGVGLQDIGLMDRGIRPLFRDMENFKHRFVGFALTATYVPTDQRILATPETFNKLKNEGYAIAPNPWDKLIKQNTVIVINASETGDVGFIGSENCMGWLKRGAVGVVTNAGARDTDELILIKAPVYTKYISRGIRPGRLRLESYNRPISCGGVLVFPGDVIVGDGDGVIVVPREKAIEAGKIARNINESDQKSRLKLYEDLGMPPDRTVEKYKEKK